jgi:predicted TIM-barrel fold metal-dependent hydrolase
VLFQSFVFEIAVRDQTHQLDLLRQFVGCGDPQIVLGCVDVGIVDDVLKRLRRVGHEHAVEFVEHYRPKLIVVFDHLAHIPEPKGINHPLFAQVRALIDKGKTWVKLSGAYADTKVGPPTYADSTAVAQAYAKAAPERCVWGSDWPHPSEREKKPDDAVLFDLLLVWAPDEKVRHRILVENPEVLYDYPKSA